MKQFKVSILSPLKTILEEGNVTSLIIPSSDGKLGIMADHAEIVCSLKSGNIEVETSDGKRTKKKIEKGILRCSKNSVLILVPKVVG